MKILVDVKHVLTSYNILHLTPKTFFYSDHQPENMESKSNKHTLLLLHNYVYYKYELYAKHW